MRTTTAACSPPKIRSTSKDGGRTVKGSYWTSVNGATWKQVAGPSLNGDGLRVLSYGQRALVVSWSYDDAEEPPSRRRS